MLYVCVCEGVCLYVCEDVCLYWCVCMCGCGCGVFVLVHVSAMVCTLPKIIEFFFSKFVIFFKIRHFFSF